MPSASGHRLTGARGDLGRDRREWPVRIAEPPGAVTTKVRSDPIDYHLMGMVVRPERSPSPPERDRVENSRSDRD